MGVLKIGRFDAVAAVLLVFGIWPRPATAQLLTPEFRVNSYTTANQRESAVAADDLGNFVVVWTSEDQDGSNEGIFGQRFDAAGGPLGGEFLVNQYTTAPQWRPAVAVDGAGNFVVVWGSSGDQDGDSDGVFARWFDATGASVGSEFRVNSYTTEHQKYPAVAANSSGNFVVVWQSQGEDGADLGVIAQRFDSTGAEVGDEFQVNSYTTAQQEEPAVAVDVAGGFVVVWQSAHQDGSNLGIYGQRFDAAGEPVGIEFRVNSFTTGDQHAAAVAVADTGAFVVTWTSNEQDGDIEGVFGQRYESSGAPAGGEFQVNVITTNYQSHSAVAADDAGRFVVAWQSRYEDGSYAATIVQRFDPAGNRVGDALQVNTYTTESQKVPALAADGSGNFVVTWQSAIQDEDSSYAVMGRLMTIAIFRGDFEVGTACTWSEHVGEDPTCPPPI
jgi:large repetitive protein